MEQHQLLGANVGEEIAKIKTQAGRNLFVFGGADLAGTLMQAGLIDEIRLIVNPVILGSGMPMFKGLRQALRLRPLQPKVFQNWNILMEYQPE